MSVTGVIVSDTMTADKHSKLGDLQPGKDTLDEIADKEKFFKVDILVSCDSCLNT